MTHVCYPRRSKPDGANLNGASLAGATWTDDTKCSGVIKGRCNQ